MVNRTIWQIVFALHLVHTKVLIQEFPNFFGVSLSIHSTFLAISGVDNPQDLFQRYKIYNLMSWMFLY